MKATVLSVVSALAVSLSCSASHAYEPRTGDIVFHTSRSPQSVAIQRATDSRYSHVGIVYLQDGQAHVLEAVEPVRLTPLDEWKARGEGGHLVVKRLARADQTLTEAALDRMLRIGLSFLGRHYDLHFAWSDESLYCSELVWKVYQRALGIELGPLEPMGSFDLADPLVQEKMRRRFGGAIPRDEPVISPAAVFASPALVTVYSN